MTPTTAVHATGLVKTFGGFRAVDGIDLEVRQGEIFGVLGPNGAGKTTTLRMLATLLPIDAGQAQVFGVDVAREPHRIRQLLGVTGQYASVDEDLTATENLWLFGRLQGLRSGGRPRHRQAAAGAVRAPGGGRQADRAVLRRHAPPPGPRGEPDHPAAADLPGRADHRPGPAHPRADVGHHPRPGRRRLHGPAHHPVPRRGRPARRPDRGHRPGPQGRRGHPGRAEEPRSGTRRCSCSSPTAPIRSSPGRSSAAWSAQSRSLDARVGRMNVPLDAADARRRRADRAASSRRADRLGQRGPSPPSTRCSSPSPATTPPGRRSRRRSVDDETLWRSA